MQFSAGELILNTHFIVTFKMKQTIKQIKISDIPKAIQHLGISENTTINFTIETLEETPEDILNLFQKIGREAQEKGLTDTILEELLADES
ncbi:MAG: hypothetical protein SAJ11_12805 [Jaaginema sp. PMC 1078.18]|nr:hypothetical protein [Jaaginema sp. PMC 1078.18]